MYLLIAALHMVPIFAIAAFSSSRLLIWITSACTAVFAVNTGNSAYSVFDLIAIAIATWLCLAACDSKNTTAKRTESRETAVGQDSGGNIFGVLSVILLAALFFYVWLTPTAKPEPKSYIIQQGSPTIDTPTKNNAKIQEGVILTPSPKTTKRQGKTEVERKRDCMKIADDQRMVDCIEKERR